MVVSFRLIQLDAMGKGLRTTHASRAFGQSIDFGPGMDSKDAIITELRRMIAEQSDQLRREAERIAALKRELARAKKDSSTSSSSAQQSRTRTNENARSLGDLSC